MISELKNDLEQRMHKCIDVLKSELSKLRTGRAHPGLIEHITVDYYGSSSPISQVASISVSDARTLTITPWEKNMVQPIEKAIMSADLGLNPSTVGMLIRVPMPALTEERRRDLIKVVRSEGENAKVAIRNIRRQANSTLEDLLKDKAITEDDKRRSEETIQKLTDKFVADVENAVQSKETDLMEV